jgi:hypothetical protein
LNVVKFLLLEQDPLFKKLQILLNDQMIFLLFPTFLLSVLLEFLGQMNFERPVRYTILALFMTKLYVPIHQNITDISFEVAEKISRKYGKNNPFLYGWTKALKKNREDDIFSKIKGFFTDDLYIKSCWTIIAVVLVFVKVIYSFIYYCPFLFITISSLLSILPLFKQSWFLPIFSTAWCFVMPIYVATISCFYLQSLILACLLKDNWFMMILLL